MPWNLPKPARKAVKQAKRELAPKARRWRKQVLKAQDQAASTVAKAWDDAKPVLRRRSARLRKAYRVATS